MTTDGKYQLCNLDYVNRNICYMLINVITKHGGECVGTEIQIKARLICATAQMHLASFVVSPFHAPPPENKSCILPNLPPFFDFLRQVFAM